MNVAAQIEAGFLAPQMVIDAYLGDLTDAELMMRPVEGTNHINWQLGHLIAAEHQMMEMVAPGRMPPLPEGFAEKYQKETAASDDPAAFANKETLMAQMKTQREGTMNILRSMSDEDLAKDAPERLKMLGPTVGSIIFMQATHYMMHAGQWVIVRRKTGKPVVI